MSILFRNFTKVTFVTEKVTDNIFQFRENRGKIRSEKEKGSGLMKKVRGFVVEAAVFSGAVVIWGIVGLLRLFDHKRKTNTNL